MDWQLVYKQLAEAGYNDAEIAKLAGVSRNVVNRVRNGKYRHRTHEPGFEGGKRLVEALEATSLQQGPSAAQP